MPLDKETPIYSDHSSSKNQRPFSGQNKDDKYRFKQFVMESGFSVRATNVLIDNVKSFRAFEQLTAEDLAVFPNCGRKTVLEIMNFLNRIGLQREIEAPVSIEELFLESPVDSAIERLPIFSNERFHQITAKDLHPDFQGAVKLEDIRLSHRTFHTLLNQGQMETIGDVMLTTCTDLLSLKNFGRKSLNEIKEVIRSLCKTGSYTPRYQKIQPADIDYSSYENLISSYSQLCIKKKRNQVLTQKMFLFDSERSPTLEEIGQAFGITRERVRQIVKKAIKQFKHTANISQIEKFRMTMDEAIADGGGIIHLQDLPAALKEAFNWPESPNPYALGQFLGIWEDRSAFRKLNDLITGNGDCRFCDIPVDFFETLDFFEHDSFHVAVIGSKLASYCREKCPWNHPPKKFHRAFIEKQVESLDGLVLYEDLVLSREKWLETYCTRLEDVACHVLERHAKPMHFSKIADSVRKKNQNFENLSDHSLHAAIIRYNSFKIVDRGTYGLASWETKTYRSVSTAIEELLDKEGLPQRRQQIIRNLGGEFSEGNITAALSVETRFKNIGDGIYDRQETWKKRTLEKLIQLLPEPVARFARYLTGKNNASYKLVMAFIFVRRMDEGGSIYLYNLKTMFYNFYLSRHKKGLPVEAKSVTMHRIGELNRTEMVNLACQEPLKSFLRSGYFTRFDQNDHQLKLADAVVDRLDASTREILIITILKAVDDYFKRVTLPNAAYQTTPDVPPPPNVSESGIEPGDILEKTSPDTPAGQIYIKKKRRGKIRL
ncbi:bacterial RNA polymerase, alpha chain C-terminal domain protein [delta proteobacterium NaphS2]|nr:bacterial RNA polymerase, alpha chain C-terminal domain protein [delta proteobacterium NaphS2]